MEPIHQAFRDSAASKVQRWLGNHAEAKSLRDKFLHINKDLISIHDQLHLFSSNEVFEDAHALLLQESYIHAINSFLKVLGSSKSMQHLKPATNAFHIARMISSALMISKFPDQVLASGVIEEADGGEVVKSAEFDLETKNCLVDSRILFGCFRKLIDSSAKQGKNSQTNQKFASLLQNFFYALRYFLKSFEEWRKADARKLAASLQDSFAQTYAVYVAATIGTAGPTADQVELLQASQKQLEKIRAALHQLLGPQIASNRIEEICAAVEATYYAAEANASPTIEPTTPVPIIHATEAKAAIDSTSLHQSVLSSSPGGDSFIGSMHQPEGSLASNHLKILNKLSQLASIGQERLAYEIVLNPYYRLPPPADLPFTAVETGLNSPASSVLRSSGGSNMSGSAGSGPPSLRRDSSNQTLSNALSSQDPASVVQSLRTQMLRMMSDKLINSVRRSDIRDISEVFIIHSEFLLLLRLSMPYTLSTIIFSFQNVCLGLREPNRARVFHAERSHS